MCLVKLVRRWPLESVEAAEGPAGLVAEVVA